MSGKKTKKFRSLVRTLMFRVRRLRHQVAFWKRTPWRWRNAWEEQEDHWDQFLSKQEKLRWRLDPKSELEGHIKEILRDVGAKARILDVGSGPLTTLGKCWEGQRLDIAAADPLAARYDSLLVKYGITPLVPVIECDGERLVEVFGENQFDLAYAKNAVDHSYDPLRVIKQMVKVVKPGGFVGLEHHLNEAENQNYVQFHQWNFDLRDGRFVIWSRDRTIDVATAIGSQAAVIRACRLPDREHAGGLETWFLVVLQKTM